MQIDDHQKAVYLKLAGWSSHDFNRESPKLMVTKWSHPIHSKHRYVYSLGAAFKLQQDLNNEIH